MRRSVLVLLFVLVPALGGCAMVGEPQRSFTGFGPPDRAYADSLEPRLKGDWWLVIPDETEPRRVVIVADRRAGWRVLVDGEDGWSGYGVNTIERDGETLISAHKLGHTFSENFTVPTYVFGTIDTSERSAFVRVVERLRSDDASDYAIEGLGFTEFRTAPDRRTGARAFDPGDADDLRRFDDLHSELITSGSYAAVREFVSRLCDEDRFLSLPLILTREPVRLQAGWSPSEIKAALAAHDPWLGEQIDSISTPTGAQR